MMKIFNILYLLMTLTFFVGITACDPQEEDAYGLGPAPSADNVNFSLEPDADNPNIIHFTNKSPGFKAIWDFGNGNSATGNSVTGIFPVAGSYTVSLTIYTSGGSATGSTSLEIEDTDPSLLDIPVYNMLTGGAEALEGKTWVIAANTAGHFGVGPADGASPSYYAAGANEKAGGGLYNDEFTFKLTGFEFIQETNGDVFVNTQQAGNFPGAYSNVGDYTAPYEAPDGLSWSITEDDTGNQFLNISDNGFIGYYTGVSTYQIMSIEPEKMVIKYYDTADPGLSWFETLIPLDVANATPPTAAFSYTKNDLEVSFTNSTGEADSYMWDFGDGSTSPDENPIHTYGALGLYTVKLTATNANGSTSTSKVVILANSNKITFEQLTGGDEKSWKLLPTAGAFGVGPVKGSVQWFGGADLSGDRPCLFNDEFIFRADDKYLYNANGDFYGEPYMGLEEGCKDEAILFGTANEDWRSATHDFSLLEGAGTDPSKITVTGTGAFIALPKAYNGGEYASGPPDEDKAVTYEVLYYVNDGVNEVMALTIDVSGGEVGGAYWTFILKAE